MSTSSIAPLKNVQFFTEVLLRTINTPIDLPRMATFHGPSGYGKSRSAIYAANRHDAIYIEVGDSWSKGYFCNAILKELGIKMTGDIPTKVDRIIEALTILDKPMIIDEFDYAVKKNFLDLVREVQDKTNIPMVLIGEELLVQKLEKNERFHNRLLEPFVAAQPSDREDVQILCKLYCPNIDLEDDLVSQVHKISRGCTRRICVNLHHIREYCEMEDLKSISLQQFGEKRLATGMSPARRVV